MNTLISPEPVVAENNPGYAVFSGQYRRPAPTPSQFAETKEPFRNEGVSQWVEQMSTERPSCCTLGCWSRCRVSPKRGWEMILRLKFWFSVCLGLWGSDNRNFFSEVWSRSWLHPCFLPCPSLQRTVCFSPLIEVMVLKNSILPPLVQYVLLVLSSLLLICTPRYL